MAVISQCFNEKVTSLPDPDNPGGTVEITPEVEAGLRARHNDFYFPIGKGLGFQFSDYGDMLVAKDAYFARDWPLRAYTDVMPKVPDDIHNAAVVTEILTGYSSIFLTQKNFMESSFRADAGNPDDVYGYFQLSRTAAREGIETLMQLPSRDLILQIEPRFAYFEKGADPELFKQDPLLKDEILDDLRSLPMASTLMAAGYNLRYSKDFQENPDIELRAAPAYLLHYLGPGNFRRFVEAYNENPDMIAYEALKGGIESPVLKHAANKAIFFDENQNPRTLQGIVDFISEDKGLLDHPVFRDHLDKFNCVEIVTGDDAVKRQSEITAKYGAENIPAYAQQPGVASEN